jgi:Lamin Tail Domain/Secretion system C-terminal sorting domain
MTRALRIAAPVLLFLLSISSLKAQFTPGNLAVLQADASANNTTATVVELDPNKTGQAPVSTVALPGSGANIFKISGSAGTTGYLANSNDGTLLCFTGINSTATGNVNALNPRVVGTLNAAQTFALAASHTGDAADGEQTRSATSLDNSTWYIGEQDGIYTGGAIAPSPGGNILAVKAFGGVVYAGQGSTTGVGILSAPSGGAITPLNGLTTSKNLVDFYLISSGSSGSGVYDVLYILATKSGTGTINKFSLVGGAWVANGIAYTTPSGGFGLAAQKSGAGANLFVSTLDGGTAGNSLIELTDATGYNTALSITAAPITLYTAPSTAVIKGVAFVPTGGAAPPTSSKVNLSVSTNTASETAATVVTVTATASAPVSGAQTVVLSVAGTGITAGDYTLSNTTITIPNGATTGSVTFTVVDDNVVEGLEVATLSIGTPSAGITLGATTSQNISIKDNDVSPEKMRITEYMYSGTNGEFIEFTNIGTTPIDMTGWSYDDNAATPGAVSLSAYGIVQPGESVVLTETVIAAFRTDWSLCNGVPVIGGNTTNISRGDQINLYDASGTLVDRLTYSDQTFPGTIRTQNVSGYPSAAVLGLDDITGWTLSAVGDAEGSVASTGGDIGTPGKSTLATVSFNPCAVVAGAPSIGIDVVNTSNFLDAGATTSPVTPYGVSSVIGDPLDPASTLGVFFTISDPNIPVGNLTVTATSSNPLVVPAANLLLTGSLASRNLIITPAAVGYSTITVTVNNGTISSSYVIDYAASQPTFTSSSSSVTWPTGISDASAAVPLDDHYMVIGDDEINQLFVFNRAASGLAALSFDFNPGNLLNLTDGTPGNYKELDIEAATSSPAITGRSYFTGSMSNSSNSPFGDEPNRDRLFAVDISGTGATTSFTSRGYVAGLRAQLVTWGDNNGYAFSASSAVGKDPKTIDGFNIEGMVFGPDNATMYIGFRAPLVPTANRTNAVIAPIANFESWYNGGAPTGNATIGTPIELNLGGRGIRDIIRLSNGEYVIAAGSYDGTSNPALYLWSGNAADAPSALSSFDVTGQNPEALVQVNQGGQLALNQLQVISDDGDAVYYNDGTEAKDLTQLNFEKFSSAVVTSSDPVALPIVFESFTAQRQNAGALLNWVTGIPDNVASFNVLRSTDGTNFSSIATVAALKSQAAYAFTDANTPTTRVYYRIQATELSGQPALSTVRALNGGGAQPSIQVYPNPVTNGVFTLITPATGSKTVSIYNSAGLLIQQGTFADTSKDFSTAGWSQGIYLIRVVMADGSTATEKLVVL